MTEQAEDTIAKIPDVRVSKLAENASICMVVPLGDPNDSSALRGVTPIYWGVPGIGKSAIVRQGAQMVLLHAETMYPSHHNPEDFSGISLPDGLGGIKTICGIPQVRRLIQRGEGILFVDEAGNAPPALQSAMLSLILERNIGDDRLPPGIRIIAAANPVDCAAGGWDFEAPTANRFLHFNVPEPSADEWLSWYNRESAPVIAPIESLWDTVCKNWTASYARMKGLVAGFIRHKPKLLHNLPPEGNPNRSRAWPSPRTWDIVGRVGGTLFALDKQALLDTFIQAAVGHAAATEFAAWRLQANLPDPADMLKYGWKPDRRRLDISIGALTGLTEFVTRSEDPQQWAIPAWGILEACCQAGMSDLAMASAESFIGVGLADDQQSAKVLEAAKPVIRRLSGSPLAKYLNV